MIRERRDWAGDVELRALEDGTPVLAGYGALFDRVSRNLGGFVEVVDRKAFTDTLSRDGNVLGVVNHDPSWLLGTRSSGSLRVTHDDRGLPYEIDLDLEDPDAIRARRKVETGKMRGSSFAFRTIADEWALTDDGTPLRRLLAVSLFDVGPVSMPAYPDTETDGKVALRSLAQAADAELDEVVAAARAGELSRFLGSRSITQELEPDPAPAGDDSADAGQDPGSPQSSPVALRRLAHLARRPAMPW